MRRASATSGGLLQPPPSRGTMRRERAQVGIERERGTKMKVSEWERKTDIFWRQVERREKNGFKIYIKAEMKRIGACEWRKCERMMKNRRVNEAEGKLIGKWGRNCSNEILLLFCVRLIIKIIISNVALSIKIKRKKLRKRRWKTKLSKGRIFCGRRRARVNRKKKKERKRREKKKRRSHNESRKL